MQLQLGLKQPIVLFNKTEDHQYRFTFVYFVARETANFRGERITSALIILYLTDTLLVTGKFGAMVHKRLRFAS